MSAIVEWMNQLGEWAIEVSTDAWKNDHPLAVLLLALVSFFVLISVVVIIRQLTGNW